MPTFEGFVREQENGEPLQEENGELLKTTKKKY